MRRAAGAVLLAVASLVAHGCGGPGIEHRGDPDLTARIHLSPTPPMVGPADLRVEVMDGAGPMGSQGRVYASPLAPDGTPGPGIALVHRDGAGWEGVVEFTVPGAQRLEIRVESPDGREATLTFPVRVTSPPASPSSTGGAASG